MQDIAKKAGVSRNTVSLALRKDPQIAEQTRLRIEGIARQLGYVRDPLLGEVMAGMRARKRGGVSRVLALVNGNADPHALRTHPTIPTYVRGCRARAAERSHALDGFWMHDPKMRGERLCAIFHTRDVRGVLIVGMMDNNRLPDAFLPVVEEFPCVVMGVRTRNPGLAFASVDHHMLALRAFERAIELGYRRPGLVLDGAIDRLVEHRFSAGYRSGQLQIPKARQLEPFFRVVEARKDLSLFRRWMDKERPDVLFTLYHEVANWLRQMEVSVPSEVALIQYEWRRDHADWAGMNQHNEISGEAAVDMLLGMIHRGEKGVPPYPRSTMIGPSWVEGKTAPGVSASLGK